uniref:CSON010435 protein n=1 Tax=Culicoides sonorensis TaxID=179676 RepID=A0A336LHT5_CULSO
MARNTKSMFKTFVIIITLNILINISFTKSTPHNKVHGQSIEINGVKIDHNNNHNNDNDENNKILDDEVISNNNNYSDDDDNDDFDDDDDDDKLKNDKIKQVTSQSIDDQIKLLSKQLNALTERRQDDLKSLENNLRKYVRKNAVSILNEDLKRELEDLR